MSNAQRNDFEWWKAAWDAAMVKEHRAHWGDMFCEWMQALIEETNSASFSQFVHDETLRALHGTKALAVPGD